MKNKILLIITLCLLFIPINTFAAEVVGAGKGYNYMNLEQSLADEEIEPVFSNYKETNKQATIYLFRGKGCSYCRSFLSYLNSIVDEYGEYFKVVSYETWYDSKNAELMNDVSNFLGAPTSGVPYIIIGEQTFPGYTESYNEEIQNAIMKLYESKKKYDVFEEMKKAESKNSNSSISSISVIILNLIFTMTGTFIVLGSINNKTKKLNERLDELEKKLTIKENKKKNQK